MIYKELPTAFPWYDQIEKQNRYRESVADKYTPYGLINPRNTLIPFEFYRPTAATVDAWLILNEDGTTAATLSATAITKIKTIEKQGRHYVYFNGEALTVSGGGALDLAAGIYYSRLTFSDASFYYSEFIQVPPCRFLVSENPPFLKLEWWNTADIAPIFYNDFTAGVPYFKNVVYLDTHVHLSEPEIIEDGEKDGNDEVIPTFQKAVLRYRAQEAMPDYLKKAIVIMQMHDKKFITTPNALTTGEISKMTTNSTSEFGGAFSIVDLIFEDYILLKKGCGENMDEVGGGGPPAPLSFDTILLFATATSDDAEGVGGTVSAINALQKFEFNKDTSLSGLPASMVIKVSGSVQIVIDFFSDYIGAQFRYTDTAGVARLGNFINGIVNF